MAQTIELTDFLDADKDAVEIAQKYQSWDNMRQSWIAQKREIQEYIFATDTRNTTNSSLPWKNRTHVPKLCNIRDNLHANYMGALFPSDDWLVWEGDDTDSNEHNKRIAIQNYMKNKLQQSGFETEVSRLVYDFIDYGNVLAMPVFIAEYTDDTETGEKIPVYVGPKAQRLSPLDLVFDPTAPSFAESPKIVRSLRTLGSLKADIQDKPELSYLNDVFDKMLELRGRFSGHSSGDFAKNAMFQFDGFMGFWEYFNSDYVEVLDFYGDVYDRETGKLRKNHLMSVVDRVHLIRNAPANNWFGTAPIIHAGWRLRQDNLYAMGPLDNLVGMQHRIDHLENAKADAFDLILHPVMKIKGYVEDFEYGPGERIYTDEDGDVAFMQPDTTFLNADTQIKDYEAKMEEMAGAPKQAVGFRTPGEKTAYEVQVLENGANRVFLNKISYFEQMFLEPLLNHMLEQARRNMVESDTVRVLDEETQAVTFQTITKEDITAKGKLRPIGARHFAQNATIVQNFTQFAASPLAQDPTVMAHISGKRVAHAIESLLGLEKFKIVQDNIRLYEQAEMQQIQASVQQAHMEEQTAGMPPDQAAQAAQGMMAQQQAGQVPGTGAPKQ